MSGYIGNIPVPQATQTRQTFTATASQTTFNTAGYSPGYIDVFLNGVKLAPADYTATNGSDVVLAVGAASGDILETVAYEIFQVLDQDFTGDFTVDGSTFVVDSTNNRVGIGTSSPSEKLEVSGTGHTRIQVTAGTSSDAAIYLGDSGDADAGAVIYDNTPNALKFRANGSERMRIDSSGNVLVGKTTIGTGTAGIALRSNGEVRGTADGDYAARFSRLTSDGSIVGFEKDGSVVGTIGTVSSELFIGTGSSGFYFDASNTSIKPRNVSSGTGSATDGNIDLGGTGNRFKDLYLSGGILADGISSVSTIREKVTVTLTTSGTINADLLSGAVVYFSANQLANRTINFRGDGSNTLNSIMDAGQSVTFAALMAQGSTAYYLNAYQVDGTSVTPKWSGGSAPTGGNASSLDVYAFTIIKTASATFTVLASLTQYA